MRTDYQNGSFSENLAKTFKIQANPTPYHQASSLEPVFAPKPKIHSYTINESNPKSEPLYSQVLTTNLTFDYEMPSEITPEMQLLASDQNLPDQQNERLQDRHACSHSSKYHNRVKKRSFFKKLIQLKDPNDLKAKLASIRTEKKRLERANLIKRVGKMLKIRRKRRLNGTLRVRGSTECTIGEKVPSNNQRLVEGNVTGHQINDQSVLNESYHDKESVLPTMNCFNITINYNFNGATNDSLGCVSKE